MAELTRKEVEEIALLARLHLDDSELANVQGELGKILEHFSVLASVETNDIQPMTHAVPGDLRLRSDEPSPSLPAAEAVRGAPAKQNDMFLVPAIISGSGE
jgi:aspartyl-tRNA(Asn)/glutamyl-tRNA(Gln) amidotransferase subunit C